jgi:glycosyltransferase involved in cell wall biosynthesis
VLEASVIVPARDAETTLPRTLEALATQDLGDGRHEVIVVDDGSSDRTVELARAAPGPVRVLLQSAQGPAQARNLGVAESTGRTLVFCDADVFPTPGWLRAGLSALEGADLVQGRVLPDPSIELGPFDRTLWVTSSVGLWETANLFVRRETFERVGGFEEWIRPEIGKAMFEDVWFGWRALRSGARASFCAEALAHHAIFERDWRGYVDERRRLRYFPAAAAKMPELRERLFFRRLFLSRRSAALDAALAGTLTALLRRSPLPLIAALPYARLALARRGSFGHRKGGALVAADIAADIVGLASLARGSLRYRSLVL